MFKQWADFWWMRFRGDHRLDDVDVGDVNSVIMVVRWWRFRVQVGASTSIASFSGSLWRRGMAPIVALTTPVEEGDGLMQNVGDPSTYGPEAPKIPAWKPLSNVSLLSAVEWRTLQSWWNHCLKLYKLATEPVNSTRFSSSGTKPRRLNEGGPARVQGSGCCPLLSLLGFASRLSDRSQNKPGL